MNLPFTHTSELIYATGWALMHTLWQGLLIYTLLRLALRFIPGNYSSLRYYTALSALGVLTTWFVATLLYQYDSTILQPIMSNNYGVSTITINSQENPYIGETTIWDKIPAWYSMHTGTVVGLYVTGIFLLACRLLYNLFLVNKLKSTGISEAPGQWMVTLSKCRQTLRINKKIRLYLSEIVTVPMVMGTLKPVVLIPIALAGNLSLRETETILLHELAHIKRNDYLLNIVQMFIETILFYNPFVWLISSIVRKEREHCCDDIVINRTGDRLPYARALATLETYRQYPAQPALAATGNKNLLLTRIKRIMEMRKNNINPGQLVAVLAVVALLIVSITFIVPEVKAQDKKNKDNPKKTEQRTDADKTTKTSEKGAKSHTSAQGNSSSSTNIVVTDKNQLESDIEKEALKTAKLALETANGVLTEIDLGGILADAMDNVDWESISAEINDSLKKVDWDAIQADVKDAMLEVNRAMKEAQLNIKEAGNEVSRSYHNGEYDKEIAQTKKELAEARKQMSQAARELAELRREQALAKREEMRAYTAEQRKHNDDFSDDDIYIARSGRSIPATSEIFVTSSRDKLLKAMEKDGLIDRHNGFKIERKGNKLTIDGIRQSKEVINKYERLLGDDDFTIKGNYRSIKISVDK